MGDKRPQNVRAKSSIVKLIEDLYHGKNEQQHTHVGDWQQRDPAQYVPQEQAHVEHLQDWQQRGPVQYVPQEQAHVEHQHGVVHNYGNKNAWAWTCETLARLAYPAVAHAANEQVPSSCTGVPTTATISALELRCGCTAADMDATRWSRSASPPSRYFSLQ